MGPDSQVSVGACHCNRKSLFKNQMQVAIGYLPEVSLPLGPFRTLCVVYAPARNSPSCQPPSRKFGAWPIPRGAVHESLRLSLLPFMP